MHRRGRPDLAAFFLKEWNLLISRTPGTLIRRPPCRHVLDIEDPHIVVLAREGAWDGALPGTQRGPTVSLYISMTYLYSLFN
jgi:hypothetical protein